MRQLLHGGEDHDSNGSISSNDTNLYHGIGILFIIIAPIIGGGFVNIIQNKKYYNIIHFINSFAGGIILGIIIIIIIIVVIC
jgi:hypothetical protein